MLPTAASVPSRWKICSPLIPVAVISEVRHLGVEPYELLSINHGVQGGMDP